MLSARDGVGSRPDGAAGGELVAFMVSVSDPVFVSADSGDEEAADGSSASGALRITGGVICRQQCSALSGKIIWHGDCSCTAGLGNISFLLYKRRDVCEEAG